MLFTSPLRCSQAVGRPGLQTWAAKHGQSSNHGSIHRKQPLYVHITHTQPLKRTAVVTHVAQEEPSTLQKPNDILQWKWEETEDALKAYGALGLLLTGGIALPFTGLKYIDLGYFVGLAVCTIYIGAHRGLSSKLRTTITLKQSLFAPIACSVALFGGYLLIKYTDLSPATLLNGYFWLLGSIAITGALVPPVRQLAGSLGEERVVVPVPDKWLIGEDGESIRELKFAPSDIAVLAAGVTLATFDLLANHQNFTLNNLIACLIATDILQLIGLRSFRTAAVMLLGLLVYDVFWVFASPSVFGDNVMLSVATSDIITGPMRLLFPRAAESTGEGAFYPFSLLGLGDVAVPGLLACLALRFDATRATDMRSRGVAAAEALKASLKASEGTGQTKRQMAVTAAEAAEKAFDRVADLEQEQRRRTQPEDDDAGEASLASTIFAPSDAVLYQRTYFTPVMFAYVLGLGAAFAANAVTNLGQPALLYLVPFCLLAVLLTAASRNEVSRVASFTDTTSGDALIRPIKASEKDE